MPTILGFLGVRMAKISTLFPVIPLTGDQRKDAVIGMRNGAHAIRQRIFDADIAKALGIDKDEVHRIWADAASAAFAAEAEAQASKGAGRSNRKADYDAVLADLRAGRSLRAVGARHGISHVSVQRIAARSGLTTRAMWLGRARIRIADMPAECTELIDQAMRVWPDPYGGAVAPKRAD